MCAEHTSLLTGVKTNAPQSLPQSRADKWPGVGVCQTWKTGCLSIRGRAVIKRQARVHQPPNPSFEWWRHLGNRRYRSPEIKLREVWMGSLIKRNYSFRVFLMKNCCTWKLFSYHEVPSPVDISVPVSNCPTWIWVSRYIRSSHKVCIGKFSPLARESIAHPYMNFENPRISTWISMIFGCQASIIHTSKAVSYTHLTLPTNREV